MRIPAREIVGGRAAFAWRRRCARASAWLRDLAALSAWAVQRDALRSAEWKVSPFGTRLTDLTSREPARAAAVAAGMGRTHRAAWAEPIERGPPAAFAATSAADGETSDALGSPSQPNTPRRSGATDAPRPVRTRAPPPSSLLAMTREQLGARAGDVARVLRRVAASPQARAVMRSVPSFGVAPSRSLEALVAMQAPRASARLRERASVRIERTLARATGSASVASAALAAEATGWATPIARPDARLVLFAPGASSAATAASPMLTPRLHALPAARPEVPSFGAPEPVPASIGGGLLAPRDKADELTAPPGAPLPMMSSSQAPFAPPGQHATVAPASGRVRLSPGRAPGRPRFDAVDFAEQLRMALVEDARRFGIDV